MFTTAFFVENYYLNLNFFQVIESALFKNEKKNSPKRCKPPKNCLTLQETEEKH